jgi:hypothetical protein
LDPPEIWLVDEPFTSEIVTSDDLSSVPVEIVLEKRDGVKGGDFVSFFELYDGDEFALFEEEEFIDVRISVLSGPRVLAVSDTYSLDVLTPEGMIQKFFYKEDQLVQDSDGEKLFEWIRDTSFPGIFDPSPEDIDQLVEDFENGGFFSAGSVYFETIRDNTANFDPSIPDNLQCFSLPEEWPPVPGKHFMFDYAINYSIWIGDSEVGSGSDRGTRHLTFYDGRAYQWSYVC